MKQHHFNQNLQFRLHINPNSQITHKILSIHTEQKYTKEVRNSYLKDEGRSPSTNPRMPKDAPTKISIGWNRRGKCGDQPTK